MRSLMPILCPVLLKGMLVATVVFFHDTSLGVMAACTTSLPDATPAAGTTYTIGAGACAGDINIANNGVTIKFLSGAEPFQAGKSIVLPASGVIVGLKVRFTGVNWGAVSQQVFSGGHATTLELQGLDVEFQGTTITSSVNNPIGLLGMLTTSSRYTVSSSTISVSTSGATDCYGLRFSGAIKDSTLSVTHGSVVTATGGKFAEVSGIRFLEDFTGSSFCMSRGSATSATGNRSGSAYGLLFDAFTNSNLCMRDGSTVSLANPGAVATGLRFLGAVTNSTICMTDGSNVTATGAAVTHIKPTSTTVESQCDPSVCPAPTATATLPEVPPRTRTVTPPMTTPVVGTTAAATAAAVTTTVATPTTAAADSTSSSSGSTGNGASTVTAAALGLVTMVLAMF